MANLLNRKEKKGAVIQETASTARVTNTTKTEATAKKNLKVNVDTHATIKALSTIKYMKQYELLDDIIEEYIKNSLSEKEKSLLDRMT